MKIFLASAARKMGYVIAVLVVIAAILLSVSRLTAPIFDEHKNDFENWASKLLDAPVTIGKVRVTWFHYEPEVSLEQVTILDKDTKKPNLQIKEVSIFFSLLKSIWQLKPIPSGIMISGTGVNIRQTENGEYSIQGFPALGGFTNEPLPAETKITDMMKRLSIQPYITLNDIDVRFTDSHAVKRYVTFYHLSLANDGNQHSISGKAILHQEIPTEVSTTIIWVGDEVDLAKIKARIYLYVSGLSLPQWFQERTWNTWQIKEGIASAKIWATWRLGALRKVQSTFQFYGLNLYSTIDKTEHKINRLSGNIGWKQPAKTNTQIFAGDDILIDLPTHLWPVTNFYVTMQPDKSGTLKPKTVNVGYIDIADVQAFLFSTPTFLSDSVKQMLTEFKPSGALQNTTIAFNDKTPEINLVSLNTGFTNLSFAAARRLPGFNNLSGMLKWDGNGQQGDLALRSNRAMMNYASIFMNPISIDQLSADAHLIHDQNNTWKINLFSLQLLNNDMAANANGTIIIPQNASPNIDLSANFTMQKATHITRYLPMRIFDPALVSWLNQAFFAGEVSSAHAVLKGKVADFPFDNNNGTFLVSGIVKNVDLQYAPNWPRINHINAKLLFSGRHITIDASQGFIGDLPIANVHGEIPDLGQTKKPLTLTVTSDEIQSAFTEGMQFVHRSPLEKTLGKMFSGINIQGPMALKIGLQVPLKTPEKTAVQGDIKFKDTKMELLPWQLTINKLNGQLHFTEKSTDAENIQGELFDKPMQFNLATIQKTKNISVVQVTFTNNFNITDLENWLKLPFSKVVQGETKVSGIITLGIDTPIQVELKSRLEGVALQLADEFAKKANETRDFTALIIAQENQPLRLKLDYDKLFDAALILARKQNQFTLLAANLHLGTGEATWPQDQGLYITGAFDELKWDKIKEYLNQSGKTNFSNLPPLKNINVNVKNLILNGLQLSQVNLDVTPDDKMWDIDITSPDVQGRIQAPINFNSSGTLIAQFQRLNLHVMSDASKTSSPIMNVKSLPGISFVANDVSYNDMQLGKIIFKGIPAKKGMTIQNLQILSTQMNLQADGIWSQENVTQLRGKATSPNVSELLTRFGIDAHNFISSKGQLTFDLNWHDAPYAPSLTSLSGTGTLNMGRGRIVDIGQASSAKMDFGKMLSIFSLQTIPRRLTFDFSDLFQKGYSFDNVHGDFSFKDGDAYTSNFRFDGPLARVNINGRIGLQSKDYDFTLSVTPYVTSMTSSLPVAAAILTGPVGGVAALAVNTVLGSALSNATTYYYSVRGPWSNPTWQTIGRQAGQSQRGVGGQSRG